MYTYIRTNVLFQSNGSQHAGQVVVPIGRDILEVSAGRVLQVVGIYPDLANAILAGTDSKVDVSAEHRRSRLLPQIGWMRCRGQFLRINIYIILKRASRVIRIDKKIIVPCSSRWR